MNPEVTTSEISPQDPTFGVGSTIDFHVRVTFFDGRTDDDGLAVWFMGTSYTAPAVPPPTECGGLAGQAAVVAAPVGAGPGGSLDASDTILVTVTP